MRLADSTLVLSATDLANHVGCRHLTQLERPRVEGKLRPPRWEDPVDVLRARGLAHEAAYPEHLKRARGLEAVHFDIPRGSDADLARARNAMRLPSPC